MSRLKKLSGWYIISKKLRGWIGAMQELYWIPLSPWIDMILQHGWLFLLIPVRCKTYFSSLKWSTKNFKSINNSRVFLAAIKFSQKQKREKDMAEEAFEKKQSSRFQTSFVRISIHQMWYLEKCIFGRDKLYGVSFLLISPKSQGSWWKNPATLRLNAHYTWVLPWKKTVPKKKISKWRHFLYLKSSFSVPAVVSFSIPVVKG